VAPANSETAAQPFSGRTRQRQWEQLSRGLYIPRASTLTEVLRGWRLVLPRCAAIPGRCHPWLSTVSRSRPLPKHCLPRPAGDVGILDLVILGDSALRTGDCNVEKLEATAAQQRRGAPRLRAVLPLLDDRSEYPGRTAYWTAAGIRGGLRGGKSVGEWQLLGASIRHSPTLFSADERHRTTRKSLLG